MSHLRKYEIEDWDFSELDPDLLNAPLVYFLKLPNGYIKVGRSEFNHNFHHRRKAAERYHSTDVEPLGIELCQSKSERNHKEKQLKEKFGYQKELLYDSPELRDYIEEHCEIDINYVIVMCHAAERKRNRDRPSR